MLSTYNQATVIAFVGYLSRVSTHDKVVYNCANTVNIQELFYFVKSRWSR